MAIFLCRLRAPRATFPGDMTEAERATMGEHAAYWQGQVSAGRAIVFGPVIDPAGIWGAAIVEAAGEGAALALTEADPVIRAGLGFIYDILAMPGAVARPSPTA